MHAATATRQEDVAAAKEAGFEFGFTDSLTACSWFYTFAA